MTDHFFKALVLVLWLVNVLCAEEYRVTPDTDLKKVCENAAAGDSIILENGNWQDVQLEFDSLSGTAASPITIAAATPGEVVLSGTSRLRLSGQYVVLSGLVFRDCFDVSHVLEMRSKNQENSNHCRITGCVFEQLTETDSSENTKWLSIYGSNHRIDHCYFAGKTTLGTTLVVWVSDGIENHRIDHNFFGPRPRLGQNGGETIRIGTSKVSESVCRTVVEDNYFYQCNGEAEIISNKSCENIYRHNVFEECAGALTLRHGHRCVVDGNVFLGNEQSATGGVRIIGEGHRVINNYFEKLRGEGSRSAISVMNGIPDGPLNGYAPVRDAIVAHNTMIDCEATLTVGFGAGSRNRTVVPEDCLIANNVFDSGKWQPIHVKAEPVGFVWKGNKQQTGQEYDDQPVEFDRVGLQLQRADDGLMRPTDRGALQTEALSAMEVNTDVDGELRGEVAIAGCDEPGTPFREFVSPVDTGPAWWRTEKGPVNAQQSFNVDSADQLDSLLESGKLTAGATIVWTAGNYTDMEVNIEGVDGTADHPVTLRAATPGSVVFTGESQFKIGAQHWVISGFHFNGEFDESGEGKFNSYNTFQFRSNGGQPAHHVRLTDCAFTNLKSEDNTSKWVLIFGQSNSIDHCHFSGKDKKGALITVELGYLGAGETAGHQIFGNYFGFVAPQEGTDNETIRIGSSEDQNKRAECSVRENYFTCCDGEPEIISSKSSYNVFERNTFRRCNGSLVLRHGHHARVEGNFFFGDDAKDAGGIRVTDSHHTIINNYMQDLTGTTWNAAFSILGGNAPSGGTGNGYQTVENITVLHNSIINCNRSFLLNKAKGSKPPTGLIANNLIVSADEPLVKDELPSTSLEWTGNLMHGAPIGADVNAAAVDPLLTKTRDLFRPDPAGPAANAAVEFEPGTPMIRVEKDIDGQSRPESGADIGADEVSGAIGDPVSVPLTPADVGVSFLRGEGPGN